MRNSFVVIRYSCQLVPTFAEWINQGKMRFKVRSKQLTYAFEVGKKGVAIWYPKTKFKTYDLNLKVRRKIFFRNIYKIGYRFFHLSKKSNKDRKIIMAFQRRFLPKEVNGKITDKTLQISQLLA